MAVYAEQGNSAPIDDPVGLSARDVVVYTLTTGANGTALTGSGQVLVVSSDADGFFHVSTTVNTDKAAAGKTHRVFADAPRIIAGVSKGDFISFLNDA